MRRHVKTPAEVLDYGWDWSRWLDGDTLASSTWTVDTGLTIQSHTYDTASTTIWLTGGSEGATYQATNTVTTAAGRTAQRTFEIRIVTQRTA